MAGEWKETSLAAVMDVKHGFAFPGKNIRDEPPGDILLTPGNFAIGGGFKGDKFKYFDGEVPEDYVLKAGDLVLTMTDLSKQADTLGYPAIVPQSRGPRFLHNQRLGKVLIKRGDELDQGFLFYLLRTEEYRNEVLASATGTTVKHTSPGRILAHKASIPPLAEQKAIAEVLGALDDKIDLNRRMNATLESMARALFQSWFVDFDPVRAKLDGRKPVALDPTTATLFPDSFQDSELGQIPKEWRIITIGETCHAIFSGGTPSTQVPSYWSGDIPWLSSGETRSTVIIDTEKKITRAGVENSSTRVAQAGCTVIAGAGQGHTRGQESLLTFESYINQSVVALAANPTVSSDLFLFFDLSRRYEEFRQISDSHSSRGSLTTKLLAGVTTVLPPHELVRAFDKAARPLTSQITANLHQSRTLATFRDILLPKLLNGELSLATADGEKKGRQ